MGSFAEGDDRMRRGGLTQILFLLTAAAYAADTSNVFQAVPSGKEKCVPITIPMCMDIQYNMTMIPNLLHHNSQEEAAVAISEFNPLVKVQCSEDFKLFLCTLHAPLCTPVINNIIQPCRHLCESAKVGCEELMLRFGFPWPERMNCNLFPDEFCVGENRTDPIPKRLNCPASMRAPAQSNYALRLRDGIMQDCSLPCRKDPVLFSKSEKQLLRVWTGVWASVSLISSIFTIFTFLIDLQRFNYPVRPILYMAMCYVGISLTYLIGVSNDYKYSCGETMMNGHSLVTQRLASLHCTLMALVYYFCICASGTWWLVLCISWFLAARMQWGQESISGYWARFHVFAWGIPALLSVVLLITERIDGDVVTGVCSVGNLDRSSMLWLVVAPQAVAILIGLVLLAFGICSMLTIRSYYKLRQAVDHDVCKLEKLMLRVSLFALLYAMPTALSLSISAYQAVQIPLWLEQIYFEHCGPGECKWKTETEYRPDIVLFAAKYLAQLIVGITCAVWVFSLKTIASYQRAYGRVFGKHDDPNPYHE